MKRLLTVWEQYDALSQKHGLAPICEAPTYAAALKTEDPYVLDFVLSTPGIKRSGYELAQSGWQLADYIKNNVVLWGHGGDGQPEPHHTMGNGVNVRKSTAGNLPMHLRGACQFVTPGLNPWADMARAMYAERVLKACSVRWHDDGPDSLVQIKPEELKEAKGLPRYVMEYGGLRFLRPVLVEFSLLPLPMDKDALARRMSSGDIPPQYHRLCVLRPGAAQDKTGHAILRLDGHPVESDGTVIVDFAVPEDPAHQTDETPPDPEEPDENEEPADEGDDTPVAEPEPETAPEVEAVDATPVADPETEPKPESDEPAASASSVDLTHALIPYSVHGNVPRAERDRPWDAGAARKRLAAWASSDGSGSKDKMDWPKFAKGFARLDSAKKEMFGAYGGPHHDLVNGKFVTVPRGVFACAQRMMQGFIKDGMPHIAAHYAQMGEKAPWMTKQGHAYLEMWATWHSAKQAGESTTALQAALLQLAEGIFGAERLPEPWEAHALPAGPESVWVSVRDVCVAVLADAVEDADVREAHAGALLRQIDGVIGDRIRAQVWAHGALEQLASAFGFALMTDADIAHAVAHLTELTGEVVDLTGRADEEAETARLHELTTRLDAAVATPVPEPVVDSPRYERLLDKLTTKWDQVGA